MFFGRRNAKPQSQNGDVINTAKGKFIVLETRGNELWCYSLSGSGNIVQRIMKNEVSEIRGSVANQLNSAVAWCRAGF